MKDFTGIVKTILHEIPNVLAIYKFGSAGTPYERADSDLDIAIFAKQKLEPMQKFDLMNKLMEIAHKDYVDVIDLLQAPTILKKEAVIEGQRVYCKDVFAADLFENTAYSEYLLFNEERSHLVKAIQERGSVYHE